MLPPPPPHQSLLAHTYCGYGPSGSGAADVLWRLFRDEEAAYRKQLASQRKLAASAPSSGQPPAPTRADPATTQTGPT